MPTERTVLSVAAAIFLVALAVYVATLAPTVFLIDSGLLTVAAASRGSAHPPGFPLFLMLTHLVTLLPIGSVAWRANLASALFAALASAAAAIVVAEVLLTAVVSRAPERRKGKRAEPPRVEISNAVLVPAMVTGALLLAFSRTLWAYATVTEVYALNTLLSCALLAVALRWRRTRAPRLLYAAAVLAGAGIGVHYLTFGFVLAGVVVLVITAGGLSLLKSRQLLIAIVLGVVTTAAVYAYLPLAARGNPALNWGNPASAQSFVRHVTAKEYRAYITSEEGGDQAGQLRQFVMREFAPAVFPAALLLAAIGLARALRRDAKLFLALLAIGVATVTWFVVYPIADDGDAYLLPLFIVLAVAAGSGVAAVARDRRALAWALVAIPAVALVAHWRDRDRSDFHVGGDYAQNALRGIERDAVVMTNDGQLWGTLMYLREAENIRRDVVLIHHGSLVRSWYLDQLVRREPQLMALVGNELTVYRQSVDIFENDEERWNSDPQVKEEFVASFNALVLALISRQLERGGHVYATPDLALKDLGAGGRITQHIRTTYDLVPGGMALEILPKAATPRPIRSVPFELRGLDDPQVRRTGGKVVEEDIVPAYVLALRLRARYHAFARQFAEARASYDAAQRLDPENRELLDERAQFDRMATTR